MKVDETIESIGRVWQQVTILIILHLVFLVWVILAGVISMTTVSGAIHGAESPGLFSYLKGFHTSLENVGLELPIVAGVIFVIYLITFQRLSALLSHVPPFKLAYSQTGLWKSSKCFDELRRLIHMFEQNMASPTLDNLEVALGLAIAQFSKEFEEHYADLVKSRIANASLWSVYNSGLTLLLLCSIPIAFASAHTYRLLFLPLGLLLSILITRCCWEVQIEHLVLGRLRFVLDATVLYNEQVVREETITSARTGAGVHGQSYERIMIFSRAAIDNHLWAGRYWLFTPDPARMAQAMSVLVDDLDLAMELMKPQERFRYRNIWLLNCVRLIWKLTDIGALPYVPNKYLRGWLLERLSKEDIRPILAAYERIEDPDFHLLDPVREQRLRSLGRDALQFFFEDDYRALKEQWSVTPSLKQWIKRHARYSTRTR